MPDLHHRSKHTNRGEEAGEEHTKVEIPTTCNHVFALTHYSVCKKIKVRKGERERKKKHVIMGLFQELLTVGECVWVLDIHRSDKMS